MKEFIERLMGIIFGIPVLAITYFLLLVFFKFVGENFPIFPFLTEWAIVGNLVFIAVFWVTAYYSQEDYTFFEWTGSVFFGCLAAAVGAAIIIAIVKIGGFIAPHVVPHLVNFWDYLGQRF